MRFTRCKIASLAEICEFFVYPVRCLKLSRWGCFLTPGIWGTMLRISLNLPTKRRHSQTWLTRLTGRLDLSLLKRRNHPQDRPLLPDLGTIGRAKRGNKFSLFFRHIFEHKKIKKLLGTNLALAIVASSLFPSRIDFQNAEENVVSTNSVVLTTERPIRYPVEAVEITQEYKVYHPGLDFEGETGEAVYPVMAGEVEDISHSKVGYGNAIIVSHGNEVTSLYAHLSNIEVEKDQILSTDTKIGEIGSSGTSSGDHLHLEIRENGMPVNPYSILPRN